jgi:hypothetical protein
MQLIPEIPNRLTIIIIQLHNILCTVIQKGTYKKYSMDLVYNSSYRTLIASSGMLINTTCIGNHIKNFLKTYKLNNSAIAVICDDTIIPQGYSSTVEASPYEYLSKHLTLPHHTLNTMYLCPYEEKFLSWWSRTPYALLMQLQLIAYTHQLNIISINTKLPALLEAYKLMYGENLRPLQLAADLQRSGYDIAATISPSVIQQFFETPRYIPTIPHHLYATILGVASYETEVL